VPPASPLPSTTVILLREEQGTEPFSVLMLERHGSIAFPGAHAFPGGVVEPGDANAPGAALPADQRWPLPEEGDTPPDALRYWVAGVRELFEEVGILLALRSGRPVEGPLDPGLVDVRARLLAGEPFGPLLEEARLVPATDRLYYFARWITPVVNPRRWDTRFLVGRVPRGAEPVVDGTETVSCAWFTPRAALATYLEGRIQLIPPTVRTLDDLLRFRSLDAVLDDARERVVRALTPAIVQRGDETAISYPNGSAGTGAEEGRRLVLRGGRWRPDGS
jgi:8-oxo-dGTP pyrophosphatase MutT (NUDIX family)